jgi:hypothetical protein
MPDAMRARLRGTAEVSRAVFDDIEQIASAMERLEAKRGDIPGFPWQAILFRDTDAFVVDLDFLKGRGCLASYPVHALLHY